MKEQNSSVWMQTRRCVISECDGNYFWLAKKQEEHVVYFISRGNSRRSPIGVDSVGWIISTQTFIVYYNFNTHCQFQGNETTSTVKYLTLTESVPQILGHWLDNPTDLQPNIFLQWHQNDPRFWLEWTKILKFQADIYLLIWKKKQKNAEEYKNHIEKPWLLYNL